MRLQKYLADCGVASRRAAERLIEDGRVTVNGATAVLGMSVEPAQDHVTVDGASIGAQSEHFYVLLNKPRGVLSTARDPHGRQTVVELVGNLGTRVYPVGRLDLDVEGALLLTNDGELTLRLTHPRYQIEKVYLAEVLGVPSAVSLRRLVSGVELEDGPARAKSAEILERTARGAVVRLVLCEGRKREVKRLLAKVGHPVYSLRRESIAGIEIGDLGLGKWRALSADECARLRRLTGL